jgi:hypothetical protein
VPEVAAASGAAFDASVAIGDEQQPEQAAAVRDYEDQVAAQEDAAIEHVEQMISDLQSSLKDRKAARAARRKKG